MINSRKETAVDIILKVSENSHGNVRSEVFIKVVAYEHGFCQLFRIKIFPRYPEHRRAFLKVFYKSSCLSLITVMKYLNFHSNGSKLESVTWKFIKNRTPSQVFLKEFYYKCRTSILKIASWWLLLRTTLFWKYSWLAAFPRQLQSIFILKFLNYTYFTFLALTSC